MKIAAFQPPAWLALLCMLAGCSPTEIRTAIDIDAPPERVWAILTDFARYPEWNPYHVSVTGKPVLGAELAVRIRRPDGKTVEIEPHILRLDPLKELTWGGGIKGIFFGEHVLRLEAAGPGRTRLIHNEDFTGAAIPFADLPPAVLTEGYARMNAALKRRAEANAGR
jgi:hypothetical protein